MKLRTWLDCRILALPLAAAVAGCTISGAATEPHTQPAAAPTLVSASGEMARPADIDKWISVGTTLRMSTASPPLPGQFRHVQLEPSAYRKLVETGAYPDGATLAASFYSTRVDESETPTLYAEDKEVFFSVEVLDSSHPDGRRFYNFTPDAKTAAALPAGNACAVCHNVKGALSGTFAQHYPVIARYAKKPGQP